MTVSSIVTIAGAKGGVGKTTTSINLATALAGEEREVVVVELDLAMANVVDFLSLPREDSDPTIHDVLAGEADPMDAAYYFEEHVAAVPSGTTLDGYVDTDMERLPPALRTYAERFDVVILDTGAGLNRAVVDPMRLADGTVVVSTPRVASVRDADKTVTLSERVDTPVYGLVLAQSGTGKSPGPDRISEFLDVDLLGHVPDDDAVPASQDDGVPVVETSPDSPAGETYREIAKHLLLQLSIYEGPADDSQVSLDDTAGDETLERALDEATAPQASGAGPAVDADDDQPEPARAETATSEGRTVVDGGTYSTDAGTRTERHRVETSDAESTEPDEPARGDVPPPETGGVNASDSQTPDTESGADASDSQTSDTESGADSEEPSSDTSATAANTDDSSDESAESTRTGIVGRLKSLL